MQFKLTSLIVLLLSFLQATQAIHFYLKSGQTKCMFENLSQNDLLIGDLDSSVERKSGSLVYEEDPNIELQITVEEIFDNFHKVMDTKIGNNGDFTFSTIDTGEHRICITPSYPIDKNAQLRVFIDMDIGNSKVLDSKKTGDIKSLKNRVNQLILRLSNIRAEQRVFREKEAQFRNKSESANSKITFWSIVQVLTLIAVCVFQLRYLKNFFVKAKVL
ncbi:hypothetical protein TBLA_0A03660 [Henningerozyma blattae CBS 6284]|uniref:GOLD domain-containing protein n=1 Tax=Henningerozyma blattae (strain ATCC 34711 / CBS 6284 / DSM 70876 / NBRC 10599 / NRRL Y-10934 / UCD 77-7) TaxID=1071380 RepID=I2GVL2_HENB6|nr:hypothetical protein TBLA_0A03660 [Tetrapisispora blattae CBS 6284]CCH58164.1 hypothetical protein TBLA_0A03660 [Tetrapisispora blattae CBS 6284]